MPVSKSAEALFFFALKEKCTAIAAQSPRQGPRRAHWIKLALSSELDKLTLDKTRQISARHS